ncbi:MAG: D-alanyl-D-alanine carboxypeptidase [Blautia sp.]|nr:D-alanyl-D-alanine carboxypeptidase [Blautia sp.]
MDNRAQNRSRSANPHAKAMKAAKMRRKRRRRIRNTILLLFLMVVIAGAIFGVLYLKRDGKLIPLEAPYKASKEFASTIIRKEDPKAKAFAEDLCVVDGNQQLEGVALEQGQNGILFNVSDCKVMYANGPLKRVYPASITKIMTAMLVFKYGNMNDVVTITQENLNLEEGSQVCGFRTGDQLTVNQLINCLLVYSGNDAASALANYIGGSQENFVQMMNDYAASLGCTGTHFTNPHGLQDDNHYTTPYDIYLMLKEALHYPMFTEITQMPSYTVEYTRPDGIYMKTTLEATDHYLTGEATPPRDVTVLGGKTGTTSDAGNCLALLSQNAYGKPFVSIIMGAESKELLYQQMNSLLMHIND